jgi:DNA repair exonuclease SbcCD ATPase subunit
MSSEAELREELKRLKRDHREHREQLREELADVQSRWEQAHEEFQERRERLEEEIRRHHLGEKVEPPAKTLKAAREQGWREPRPEDYGGSSCELKGHTLVKDCEQALGRYEWMERGRRVKQGRG